MREDIGSKRTLTRKRCEGERERERERERESRENEGGGTRRATKRKPRRAAGALVYVKCGLIFIQPIRAARRGAEEKEEEARERGACRRFEPRVVNVIFCTRGAARRVSRTRRRRRRRGCWRTRTSASASDSFATPWPYVGSGRTPPRVGVSVAEPSPGISPGMLLGMFPSPFAPASPSASPSASRRRPRRRFDCSRAPGRFSPQSTPPRECRIGSPASRTRCKDTSSRTASHPPNFDYFCS